MLLKFDLLAWLAFRHQWESWCIDDNHWHSHINQRKVYHDTRAWIGLPVTGWYVYCVCIWHCNRWPTSSYGVHMQRFNEPRHYSSTISLHVTMQGVADCYHGDRIIVGRISSARRLTRPILLSQWERVHSVRNVNGILAPRWRASLLEAVSAAPCVYSSFCETVLASRHEREQGRHTRNLVQQHNEIGVIVKVNMHNKITW